MNAYEQPADQTAAPAVPQSTKPSAAADPGGFKYEVDTRYGTVEVLSPRALTREQVMDHAQRHFDDAATRSQQDQPTSWQDMMTTAKTYRRPVLIAGGAGVGALRGAAMGATAGAPAGPWGAGGGAVVGGLIGAAYGGAAGALANTGMEALPPAPASLAPFGGSNARPSLADINREAGAGAVAGMEGQVYGNVAGPLVAGGLAGMLGAGRQGAMQAARGALAAGGAAPPSYIPHAFRPMPGPGQPRYIAQDARSFGVDLSAGEQVGVPFLRVGEGLAGRFPTGQNVIARFGQTQTEQLLAAGKRMADEITGVPAMDAATRNNRFLRFLRVTVDETKAEGNRLFAETYDLIGPKTPTTATNTQAVAQQLVNELPTVGGQGLKGFGLGQLDDLVEKVLGTNAENLARKALGLPPGTPLPPGTQIQGGARRQVTVEEFRKLQTALGPLAFPDKFEGAVVVDAAVTRNARRLWGAVSDDVMDVAKQKGSAAAAALENAKQFWSTQVRGMDGQFYADLLAANKDLGQLNSRLFSPQNIGILIDARKVVSEDGWKLIQQQWWDHAWQQSVTHNANGTGLILNGKRFADLVLNPQNKQVLSTLFDPETVENVSRFAQVTQAAMPTASQRSSDFFGSFLGLTQAAALGHMGTSVLSGNGLPAASLLYAAGPWVFAKMLTNPTTANAMISQIRSGREWTPAVMDSLLRAAIRFKVIVPPNEGERPVSPQSMPSGPTGAGINMRPGQLVGAPRY